MRNAELASHQVFERTWRFRSRGSMLVSVSIHPLTQGRLLVAQAQEALGVVDEPLQAALARPAARSEAIGPALVRAPSGAHKRTQCLHGVVLRGNPIQPPRTACGRFPGQELHSLVTRPRRVCCLGATLHRACPDTPIKSTLDLKSSKETRWI